MKKIIALLALLNVAVFAQNTFTDPRDGKKYKYVKIGNQTWMAQNLDYHGEDGFLGLCYGDEPQKKIKKPENCRKYGRLYDYKEARQSCPKDWHLASEKEWQTLLNFISGREAEVINEMVGITQISFILSPAKKLKSKSGWEAFDFSQKSPNAPKCKWTELDNRGRGTEIDMCTTDEYGFSALPGGLGGLGGNFASAGTMGYWWSDCGDRSNARQYSISYGGINNKYKAEFVMSYYADGGSMFSVRCVQSSDKTEHSDSRGSATESSSSKASNERNVNTSSAPSRFEQNGGKDDSNSGSSSTNAKAKGSFKAPKASDIDMSSDASRSKAEIMQVVVNRMSGIKNFHGKYLKMKPDFSGKVTVKFTIAPGGDIVKIGIVSSTTGYAEFDAAVKNMVATWSWKAIKSGNTTVTIPFSFE